MADGCASAGIVGRCPSAAATAVAAALHRTERTTTTARGHSRTTLWDSQGCAGDLRCRRGVPRCGTLTPRPWPHPGCRRSPPLRRPRCLASRRAAPAPKSSTSASPRQSGCASGGPRNATTWTRARTRAARSSRRSTRPTAVRRGTTPWRMGRSRRRPSAERLRARARSPGGTGASAGTRRQAAAGPKGTGTARHRAWFSGTGGAPATRRSPAPRPSATTRHPKNVRSTQAPHSTRHAVPRGGGGRATPASPPSATGGSRRPPSGPPRSPRRRTPAPPASGRTGRHLGPACARRGGPPTRA